MYLEQEANVLLSSYFSCLNGPVSKGGCRNWAGEGGCPAEMAPAVRSGIPVPEASRLLLRERVSLKARPTGEQESRQTEQVQIDEIKITEAARQESQHRA